ncbi:MAG: thioredoxin-disulfide reductase [Deltaproteobacteria bacterium]|nr:thioredoxin-disulfide reductase [Deltaproteobacteria bacterium]
MFDVIILGSGPAGLTAGIYCARANLKTLILEGLHPGGQLVTTTEVENFPGFPDGILGPLLIERMKNQSKKFGCEFILDHAVKAELSKHPKVINGQDKQYRAKAVIVSTGARSKFLNVPNETELLGYGVSTCAVCDGAFFKDKTVAVIGGGDSAAEESLFLTKFARKVFLIHRRDKLRASKIMQDRIFANKKIEVLWDSVVVEIIGNKETKVKGVKIRSSRDNTETVLDLDGVFIAIGHVPNTDFLHELEKDEKGYIIPKYPGRSFTSVEGVFVAGDCSDSIYRQAVTASAYGCIAAIECVRWLEENYGI